MTGDCGEDGIVAVNLTRPIDLASTSSSLRSHQRRTFQAAVEHELGSNTELKAQVSHFIGGPCEEEQVAACIVMAGGKYNVVQEPDCLESGIRLA